jgi:hypothetical protein
MKRFLLYTLAVVIVACTACDKFLDEDPTDRIPDNEAYNTEGDLYRNAVASLYGYVGGNTNSQGLQGTGRGVYDLNTFTTDEAIMPTRGADWYDGGFWQDLFTHQWGTSNGAIDGTWDYLFRTIIKCNESLEHIDAFLAQHKSNDNAAKWRAEVRGLRAMFYFYAMDLYGRVPVFTKSSPEAGDMKLQPRSTTFNFIRNELLDILPMLNYDHSNKHGEYYGRFTYSVAVFLLAKLALNAEVYCHDNWTDAASRPNGKDIEWTIYGSKMNTWEAVVYFCDDITRHGYMLDEYFSQPFAVNNENSAENIFIIPMDKHLYSNQQQNMYRSYHYRHAAAYGFTGENGTCATLQALKMYGYGTDELDHRFHMNFYYGAVNDLDGDPVLDRTGQQLVYYPDKVEMDLSFSDYLETAGARMKKYEVDKVASKDGKLMDNDIVLFRFADVLLMRAEAYLRLGKASQGQKDLDLVRKRARMKPVELTMENLERERFLELCWEGWRRQDMIRFGHYKSLYQGEDGDEPVDESDGHTTVFPIPADVRALNQNLTQNQGY